MSPDRVAPLACLRLLAAGLLCLGASVSLASAAHAAVLRGQVRTPDGDPVVGAMLSFRRGDPIHEVTVFSGADGGYASPELEPGESFTLRVRRIGWRDLRWSDQRAPETAARLDLTLEPETDPAALAAQLPANRWFALLLERIDDEAQREELVRQCTYCHQQGSPATRIARSDEEWEKLLALMARMGGILSEDLRERIPKLVRRAYAPSNAVPRLTEGSGGPDFAPPPADPVLRATIEEWELGHRASMQHDLVVHPDGRIYSVDMTQDKLYRLDPAVPGGERAVFDVPRGDLPLGGVFGVAGGGAPLPSNASSHVGPHSIQVAPDGSLWTTLALGNQLARFDPADGTWQVHALEEGFYPHTLRFDARGRIWYTVAASNHIGMLDPASGESRQIRLPATSLAQAAVLRMLPFFLWLNRQIDLTSAAGEGMRMPVPYGIDVAPDGGIWFSQLNESRIGRVDPESFEIEMIDTPFSAPRRLRFDSKGGLWIPGFSSGLVARFDLETRRFETFALPVEPAGSETPYALNVDRRTDTVWICGTNSDSLIRFDPERADEPDAFTVYPLPTRVTYTREIDFDERGRVWTSNSNLPTWQIEGGFPRVLRLDPAGREPASQEVAVR